GRIKQEGSDPPIYVKDPRAGPRLLGIWSYWVDATEARAYVTGSITADSSNAIRLLVAVPGRAWGLESGLSHRDDFDRHDYDAVVALVDPDVVLHALRETHPHALSNNSSAPS